MAYAEQAGSCLEDLGLASTLVECSEFSRLCRYAGLRLHLQTEDWQHWKSLYRKLPATAAAVFTYWELCYDLCGQPDAQRRELLRRMLDDLGRPRGTVAFWPLATLDAGVPVPSPDCFWHGVNRVQASDVLCFGQSLFEAPLPQGEASCETYQAGSVKMHRLPSLESIIAGGEDEYQRVITKVNCLLNTVEPIH